MTNVFKPIRPKKISEEIVEQIKALISSGDLKPGDRVPSEREMANLLGVSRPSVREAIMVLEAMGLLESRQGGGTFVRSLTEVSISDPLSTMVGNDPTLLLSLVEIRMGLESWSAYLAAQRITDKEISELREILNEMEKDAASGGWDADIDSRFHYVITTATHNTLQLHLLDTIHGLYHATIQVALMEFYKRKGYIEILLDQHRAIFDAVSSRDANAAREAMMAHLTFVMEKMNILRNEAQKQG